MSLPRVYWDADGDPLDVAGWSANSVANLGYDQMRGTISARRARSSQIKQGSIVTGVTESGTVMWQGRLSGPPKLKIDGTADIAAQGFGYAAAKYAGRVSLRIADMAAWQHAGNPPLNAPTLGTYSIGVQDNPGTAEAKTFLAWQNSSFQLGSAGIWSPGTRFTRFRADVLTANGLFVRVYTADGPNVAATRRVEYQIPTGSTTGIDVTFRRPGDAVLIESDFTGSPDSAVRYVGDAVVLYGDVPLYLYADAAAKAIASRLDYDPSGIDRCGGAQITQFDFASNAADALTDAASEDLRWRVLDDRGAGPRLEFGTARKVWEVSGRTGARWSLDPLELYTGVKVQFLTTSTVSAIRTLSQVAAGVQPWAPDDVFNRNVITLLQQSINEGNRGQLASGVANTLGVNLTNLQQSAEYATSAAYKILRAAFTQRLRGSVEFARAFEGGTGREAAYEVRGGDLLKITDHTSSSDVILRIADVAYSPQGVSCGIEAPSLPAGVLAGMTGGQAFAPPGGGVISQTQGASYIPPGAPGGAQPWLPSRGGLPPGVVGGGPGGTPPRPS